MTVTIQLTTAGIDTGNFSIFSNLDLVTPIVTGISRTTLQSGYAVVVPDAATSVTVKSTTANCTNSVVIPISGITTTTTTTTLACFSVTYGYDFSDPTAACYNYNDFPVDYYWNGTTLFNNPGCSGVADIGYYSDGSIISYWNGSTLDYDSDCPTTSTITIQARRVGSVMSSQNVNIVYSTDYGTTWNSIGSGNNSLTTSYSNIGQAVVDNSSMDPLYIGVLKAGISEIDVNFSVGNLNTSYNYCGKVIPPYTIIDGNPGCYNDGIPYLDHTIYINVPTDGFEYMSCF